SAWNIIKWFGTGIVITALFNLSFTNWHNHWNERIILNAFEHGSCSEPDVKQKQLIYCEVVIKELRRILEPISDHSSYHVVVGNHGTGKTTVIRQCARDVGKEVIYVDVPPVLNRFISNLANAIGYSFMEYVFFIETFKRKILGNSESGFFVSWMPSREELENTSKPPVLILDNINKLGQENANMLKNLQDIAKLYADQSSCIIVFISSEGTAPHMMMQRSSWSRAEKDPIVIEDLTSKEAFTYLHNKLGIEKEVTNQLIQLLGGRIRDLKEYGNRINRGKTFESESIYYLDNDDGILQEYCVNVLIILNILLSEVHKTVIHAVNHNFHQAEMMEGEKNHVIGKVIVQKLVKNEKIDFDTFIKLVNNKKIADELLQANVFSYNPESRTVTFQSRATEVFVRESPEFR
ncbi:12822_t:CDS:2, partial [Dentiscutata erythropus]